MNTAIKDTLAAIGTRAEIAAECDVQPIAVYRWEKAGRIPSQYLPIVLALAKRKRAGVSADDLIAAHEVSPSSDVSQPMVSCPPKNVGTRASHVKGAV